MARIRHIAIVAKDAEQVATFYKSAFGMQEAYRQKADELPPGEEAIYLTDGYINLAVLPITHRKPEGMYHFGFEVDDVAGTLEHALACGGDPPPYQLPRDGRFAETFVVDPVGIKVDIATGWKTTPIDQPAEKAAV